MVSGQISGGRKVDDEKRHILKPTIMKVIASQIHNMIA